MMADISLRIIFCHVNNFSEHNAPKTPIGGDELSQPDDMWKSQLITVASRLHNFLRLVMDSNVLTSGNRTCGLEYT